MEAAVGEDVGGRAGQRRDKRFGQVNDRIMRHDDAGGGLGSGRLILVNRINIKPANTCACLGNAPTQSQLISLLQL